MPNKINLIEIICCYEGRGDPTPHYALAEKIASRFGWHVFFDE